MPETIDLLALLGWMDETEAAAYLRQGRVGAEPLSEAAAQRIWSEYRGRTAAAALERGYQPPGYRLFSAPLRINSSPQQAGTSEPLRRSIRRDLYPFNSTSRLTALPSTPAVLARGPNGVCLRSGLELHSPLPGRAIASCSTSHTASTS